MEDIQQPNKLCCNNCSRNKTVGHLYGDIYVKYCFPYTKSVYTDTIIDSCLEYHNADEEETQK